MGTASPAAGLTPRSFSWFLGYADAHLALSVLYRAHSTETQLDPSLVVVLDVLLDPVYQCLDSLILVKVTDLRLEVSEEAFDDAIVIAVPLVRHAPLYSVPLHELDIDTSLV